MLRRYRRNTIIIGVLLLIGWAFYTMYKNSAIERLYTQHEFNEDIGKIYVELAQLAQDRRDYPAAITFYKNAVQHRLTDLVIYDQMGICLELNQKPEEALKVYFKAMSINPNFSAQRFNDEDGVTDRENQIVGLPAEAPRWKGEALNGKSIYVYAEQSLGDTIQFCRFLPNLVKQGAVVYFRPQKELYALIKNANFPVNLINSPEEATRLSVDYYASLLDLMHYLGVGIKDIDTMPYLKNSSLKQSRLVPEINNRLCNIGIVWQSDQHNKNASVPLSMFYDLASMRGVKIYALQMGAGSEQLNDVPAELSIVDATIQVKDLADMASVIMKLDLLITVDSAIVHLGGALGKATWMLTPYETDWRWLGYTSNHQLSWYQNFVLMRQDESCSWQSVFNRIQAEIKSKITTL